MKKREKIQSVRRENEKESDTIVRDEEEKRKIRKNEKKD